MNATIERLAVLTTFVVSAVFGAACYETVHSRPTQPAYYGNAAPPAARPAPYYQGGGPLDTHQSGEQQQLDEHQRQEQQDLLQHQQQERQQLLEHQNGEQNPAY